MLHVERSFLHPRIAELCNVMVNTAHMHANCMSGSGEIGTAHQFACLREKMNNLLHSNTKRGFPCQRHGAEFTCTNISSCSVGKSFESGRLFTVVWVCQCGWVWIGAPELFLTWIPPALGLLLVSLPARAISEKDAMDQTKMTSSSIYMNPTLSQHLGKYLRESIQ
jgi:hypothetical protein